MDKHLETIKIALKEDLDLLGDITTDNIYSEKEIGKANFVCESDGILSGASVLIECFKEIDNSTKVTLFKNDSEPIKTGDIIACAEGSIRSLLAVERTALNFLSHLSGIATLTGQYVQILSGTGCKLKDTRKTIPGLRLLQKEAVKHGGGVNHRMGLFDAILIKDNHLENISLMEALKKIREKYPQKQIEIEVENLEQVQEALNCGVDILLLDNMSESQLIEVVKIIDKKVATEASGGINLENILQVANTGVDFISTSTITMAAPPLSFKLELLKDN